HDPSLPRQWRANVNKPQTEAEVASIRKCIIRGSPFGDEAWTKGSVARLSLERTLRPRGRPKKLRKES
ncbi:MAG: transposase, partial [Planctomycetota bacterium]|nr:transposase [Planctomycetota bacterium]